MVWVELLRRVQCMLGILENRGKSMTIDTIRDDITNHIGNEILVIHNEGRNRILEYRGKVVEVYHNIFIVLDNEGKKSFSYHDIFTETVKISFKS